MHVSLLNKDINIKGIHKALAICKRNRAPGENQLTYEFLKNLPSNWLLYMCHMFNKVLEYKNIPEAWATIILKMLYNNKGSKDALRPLSQNGSLALEISEAV